MLNGLTSEEGVIVKALETLQSLVDRIDNANGRRVLPCRGGEHHVLWCYRLAEVEWDICFGTVSYEEGVFGTGGVGHWRRRFEQSHVSVASVQRRSTNSL